MFHSNYFKIFSKPFPNGSLVKVASHVKPTVMETLEVQWSKIGVMKGDRSQIFEPVTSGKMVIFGHKWPFFGSRRRVPASLFQKDTFYV